MKKNCEKEAPSTRQESKIKLPSIIKTSIEDLQIMPTNDAFIQRPICSMSMKSQNLYIKLNSIFSTNFPRIIFGASYREDTPLNAINYTVLGVLIYVYRFLEKRFFFFWCNKFREKKILIPYKCFVTFDIWTFSKTSCQI